MPPAIKLTYFPIVGRLAPVRVALALKGIPFELEPIPFAEWSAVSGDRARFPLGDIPTLTVDGAVVAETSAIIAYAGQLTGLWPTTPLGAARAVELLSTIEHFFTGAPNGPDDYNFVGTLALEGEQQRAARAGPVSARARFYFRRVDEIVGLNPSGFAIGDSLTIVDIWIVYNFYGFASGYFAHVDPTLHEGWPNIAKLAKKLEGDEALMKVFKEQTAEATVSE